MGIERIPCKESESKTFAEISGQKNPGSFCITNICFELTGVSNFVIILRENFVGWQYL